MFQFRLTAIIFASETVQLPVDFGAKTAQSLHSPIESCAINRIVAARAGINGNVFIWLFKTTVNINYVSPVKIRFLFVHRLEQTLK